MPKGVSFQPESGRLPRCGTSLPLWIGAKHQPSGQSSLCNQLPRRGGNERQYMPKGPSHPPLGDVEGARVVVEHVGNANFQTKPLRLSLAMSPFGRKRCPLAFSRCARRQISALRPAIYARRGPEGATRYSTQGGPLWGN